MSLSALIYSKIRITSVDNMILIVIVGNQLYSSLSLLKRQSLLMLTELPGMLTVFERFFQLEYGECYTCNMHGDVRIEGYHYCICHWVQHLNSKYSWVRTTTYFFNGGNYWCWYLQHWVWAIYKVFGSRARDMYGTCNHSEGRRVSLEIPSIYLSGFVQTWLKKFQVYFNYLTSYWNGKQRFYAWHRVSW